MSNKRIDLTQFEGHTSDWSIQEGPLPTLFITDNDGVIATMEMDAEERYVADSLLISKAPDLLDELKRCYEKEDEIIEYVGYLLATPDVLERLMGSPSQIHTINNLTNSLEKLLEKLKNKASE